MFKFLQLLNNVYVVNLFDDYAHMYEKSECVLRIIITFHFDNAHI